MTSQEAKKIIEQEIICARCDNSGIECDRCEHEVYGYDEWAEALEMAVVALQKVAPLS